MRAFSTTVITITGTIVTTTIADAAGWPPGRPFAQRNHFSIALPHEAAMIPLILAVASGHTGVARVRTGPEPSDVALFLLAVLAVWFVRRRLRARFRDRPDGRDPSRRRRD